MCHGYEWEVLKQEYAQEIARRNREKAVEEGRRTPATAPEQRAPSPARNEEPVPA